jgi:hypothetical protein
MNKKLKKNDEVKKTDGKKVKINNSVKGSVYERWENEKSPYVLIHPKKVR